MKNVLVPLALAAALGAVAGPAVAARPPAGRTYFTLAVGLEEGYELEAYCFTFMDQKLCSLDGRICGLWRPLGGERGQRGFSFELTTLEGGGFVELEGQARLDGMGPGSSLAGTGRLHLAGEPAGNFSFAAREVDAVACLELLDDAPGDDDRPPIAGSGHLVTEEREVEDFHGLVALGEGRIEVHRGDAASLRITADDNLLPILTSAVRDGRLILDAEAPFETSNDIRYEITVRELDEITLAGVFGAEVLDIDAGNLTVSVSGVSVLTAAGFADRQQVSVAGVSRYDARDLASRIVEIDVSGLSSAVVRVSERLSGSVTGGSTLEYIGSPAVDVTVDLLSTLRNVH